MSDLSKNMSHLSKKKKKLSRSRGAAPLRGAASSAPAPRPAAGHLDAAHAARLHQLSTDSQVRDADVGFVRGARSRDELTERLGEEAVSAMTSGESNLANDWDETMEEESGGPFVETSANEEFADGTDESNIAEATREAFPTTSNSK